MAAEPLPSEACRKEDKQSRDAPKNPPYSSNKLRRNIEEALVIGQGIAGEGHKRSQDNCWNFGYRMVFLFK